MKKLFLFVVLLALFFHLSSGVVWAFCNQDSDCGGGTCQNNECVSQASSEQSSQATGGSGTAAGVAKQVGQVYGEYGVDQRCMTKKECMDIRKKSYDLTDAQAAEGFYAAKDHTDAEKACKGNVDSKGNEMGFCSPVGQAKTEISFGGKNYFANLGEFIQYIYRYTILVAAILAVVMLIFAGVQWLTSAGSSEKTGSAKKKISGALVGLLIALLSYNILNLLNPYMVNLRLPQVWILKPQDIVPKICPLAGGKLSFAYNEDQKKNISNAEIKKKYDSAKYTTEGKSAQCRSYYFLEGAGNKPCAGTICGPGKACIYGLDNKLEYNCVDAILAGKISVGFDFRLSELGGNVFDNNLLLIAMCPDGGIEKIDDMDLPDDANQYAFPNSLKESISKACGGKPAGFYFGGEINDGSNCDDWHAIGQSTNGKCDLNLGMLGYQLLNKVDNVDCSGDNGKYNCSCGTISDEPKIEKLSAIPEFTKHLISRDQLLSESGFQCDITISRTEFPDLVNSCTMDDDTDCWDDQNSL
jgi:hypothetical protein